MPEPEKDQRAADAPAAESDAPQHHAQPPTHAPATEAQIRAALVGGQAPGSGPIVIVDYDPQWSRLFARERDRIHAALGERVLRLEHVGSTSVPGLAAKPRIDLLLVVADSADEPSYVPALESAGYVLRIREPDWYKHRMFKGPDTDINLHVFSTASGDPEIERMLRFRDWLRTDEPDRRLYERAKRELAAREWKYTQNYADAKTSVVEEILARARTHTDANRQDQEQDQEREPKSEGGSP